MRVEQFILVNREPWVSADNTVYPCNTRISLNALHVGTEPADIIRRQNITPRLYGYEHRCRFAIYGLQVCNGLQTSLQFR